MTADDINMATNNIELRSIRSLSGLNFYIPDYQRGYRWSDGQVKQMLNDFKEFCKRIDEEQVKAGEFYCLQPIVIKKKLWTDTDGDLTIEGYEVMDGQQRLTTLYIILNVLKFVLTNVNWQRNASPYFQMFAFSFFGGYFICRFLPIFCPSDVPRHNLCPSKKCYIVDYHRIIFVDIRFCIGK